MSEVAEIIAPSGTQQTAEQTQIQEFERMAFGGDKPQVQQVEPTTPVTEAIEPVTTTPSVDYLKELGYENIDAAKAEIESLRQFKANPPSEFKLENEESRKMAEAVSKGDRKSVLEILQKQERIENLVIAEVTKETAPDIIKLGLKLKYPTLTDSQIEFQYNQDYGIPKEPIMRDTDDPDEFNEKHDEWKQRVSDIEMKAAIAATMAKPDIEAAKTKIDISSILSPSTTVDKDFEAYKASNASAEKFYNEVSPQIQALKESDVPLAVSIKDENNKMNFDISIIPETTDFETARQDSLAWDVFRTCYDKEGKFIPQNLQRISLLANNFDKYAQSIARQAVNAERKRVIEEETRGNGIQRDFNTIVEPTELQKMEKMAFG